MTQTDSRSTDLPTAPDVELDAADAMPTAAAREQGDYAEGDYNVSVKTKDAPSMDESHFAEQNLQAMARQSSDR